MVNYTLKDLECFKFLKRFTMVNYTLMVMVKKRWKLENKGLELLSHADAKIVVLEEAEIVYLLISQLFV